MFADQGTADRAASEGQYRPGELLEAIAQSAFLGASQQIHDAEYQLRDVAGHHRGGRQVVEGDARRCVLHAHGGRSQHAGQQHPRRAGVDDRLGVPAAEHARREQGDLQLQQWTGGRPAAALRGLGEQARSGDRDDEGRKGQELDRHAVDGMHDLASDENEVAGHVGREQAEQQDEAGCVDIAGDERQRTAGRHGSIHALCSLQTNRPVRGCWTVWAIGCGLEIVREEATRISL